MNREVCEHFNPVDLPCAKCAEKRKSEAMFLADELDDIHTTHVARNAAAELRRLHAENERLHQANEAFGKRQQWWNERMFTLEQQRDALLSLLGSIRGWDVLDATADGTYWKREIDAAIKAVEEGEK